MNTPKSNFLEAYLKWMTRYPLFNLVCLMAYYLAVVLPHKAFGTFLNTVVFNGISRDQYNLYVGMAAAGLLLMYIVVFLRNSQQRSYRKWLWLTMLINVTLAIIAFNILFVINIEAIHFIQYAVFAVLLFPLLNNYWEVLVLGVIAGAIDEAYQYFYLAPEDTSYYDFNDVVTNLIGVVFGLLLVRSEDAKNTRVYTRWRSPALIATGLLTGVFLLAYFSNVLSIYPGASSSYQLVNSMPDGFWSRVHPNVTYHVILPLEGLVITAVLLYQLGGLLNKQ